MTSSTQSVETSDDVHPDAVLSAVASERRRAALRVLADADGGELDFDTLVDRVVERLREDDGEPVLDYRQRVRTELHHSHLPKLEACGLVVYNTETKRVRDVTGELGRELLTVVDSYETHD